MKCCVPTFRAGSFPSRIQRRTVSGFLPVRRAASGTVIMRCSIRRRRAGSGTEPPRMPDFSGRVESSG